MTPEVADFYAHVCPAGVYERVGDELRVNPPNCVDCKATDVLGPALDPAGGRQRAEVPVALAGERSELGVLPRDYPGDSRLSSAAGRLAGCSGPDAVRCTPTSVAHHNAHRAERRQVLRGNGDAAVAGHLDPDGDRRTCPHRVPTTDESLVLACSGQGDASSRLEQFVTWCLDQRIETGTIDLVNDLANPIPAMVTLDHLGLPVARSGSSTRHLPRPRCLSAGNRRLR